jgi:hypothetical protein
MVLGLFIIAAGVLALLFYVMHLVKPKRVRVSAKILKVVELNVEAEGANNEPGKAYGEIMPLGGGSPREVPESRLEALPEGKQKALP